MPVTRPMDKDDINVVVSSAGIINTSIRPVKERVQAN